MDLDVDAVADELYGLPPGEFTSQRDRRAAEARRGGDRDLAAAIKKLRRPSASAWLANLLVRQRHEQLLQLLELGAAMRQAQSELAGTDLRRLSEQRHQVVKALGGEGRQLARDLGQPVSEASERELEATLEAAVANAEAGEALRSGRLTTALSYSGLGLVDLAGRTPHRGRRGPDPFRPTRAAPILAAPILASRRRPGHRGPEAA